MADGAPGRSAVQASRPAARLRMQGPQAGLAAAPSVTSLPPPLPPAPLPASAPPGPALRAAGGSACVPLTWQCDTKGHQRAARGSADALCIPPCADPGSSPVLLSRAQPACGPGLRDSHGRPLRCLERAASCPLRSRSQELRKRGTCRACRACPPSRPQRAPAPDLAASIMGALALGDADSGSADSWILDVRMRVVV